MATARLYGKFPVSLMNGKINFSTDTIKVMLCTSSYTPNQDTHQWKSDVTNEVTGTGYTAGGATISPITVSYDSSTNKASFDGADAAWPTSTITARYAVIYDATPSTDATRPLIGYVDFLGDISSTTATFGVVWDAAGIAYVTVT